MGQGGRGPQRGGCGGGVREFPSYEQSVYLSWHQRRDKKIIFLLVFSSKMNRKSTYFNIFLTIYHSYFLSICLFLGAKRDHNRLYCLSVRPFSVISVMSYRSSEYLNTCLKNMSKRTRQTDAPPLKTLQTAIIIEL